MSYDLYSTGLTDLKKAFPWVRQKFSRVALMGLADGDNQTFHTRHFPLEEDTVSFYTSGGSGLLVSTLDEETGAVVFANAPSDTVYGDYYFVEKTNDEMKDILVAGFDEMETRWSRGWELLESGSAMYVTDDDGVDPIVYGSTHFSESRGYIRILLLCSRYTYLQQRMEYEAGHGLSYRQEGGFGADNRARSQNLGSALERLDKQIVKAIQSVLVGLSPTEMGDYLKSVHSDSYDGVFRWQGGSSAAVDSEL